MKLLKKFSLLSFTSGITAGVLLGTAASQGSLGSSVFPDVTTGSYYDAAIGEMVSLGIITGFGDGTFKPDEPLTRGQAAMLLKRFRDEANGDLSSSSHSSSSSATSSSSSSNSSSSSSNSSSSTIPSAGLLRFTTVDYPVDENDGTVSVTLVRAGGNRGRVTADYYLVPDTATADVDYEVQEGTLVFADGETSVRFDLEILNDSDQEGDEKFIIKLRNITGGSATTTPSEATVTIRDDETPSSSSSNSSTSGPTQGTLGFSAIGYSVSESNNSITVRVKRTNGSTGSVSVEYSMSNGSADSSDYQSSVGTLSFAAGETEKQFTVSVLDNGSVDGNRTVNLTLSKVVGGAVLGDSSAILTIYDDEVGNFGTGSLKLSDDEYEATENEGSVTVTVQRVGGSTGEISVKYLSIAGTATNGSDYQDVNDVLVFKAGESSKTFSMKIYDDSATDGGETVTVRIQDATHGAQIISPSSATVTIY